VQGFSGSRQGNPSRPSSPVHAALTPRLLQVGAEHQTWFTRERFSNRNDAEQHASCAALHGLAGAAAAALPPPRIR
jgi:hypothetical protein